MAEACTTAEETASCGVRPTVSVFDQLAPCQSKTTGWSVSAEVVFPPDRISYEDYVDVTQQRGGTTIIVVKLLQTLGESCCGAIRAWEYSCNTCLPNLCAPDAPTLEARLSGNTYCKRI